MKMQEALLVMEGASDKGPNLKGYCVYFWWHWGPILGKKRSRAAVESGWFPSYGTGEPLLDLETAKEYCRRFGEALGDQVSAEVRSVYWSVGEGYKQKKEWKPG